MLARSGQLPTRGDWAYEVKWDGFRAIVSTEGEALRVRSRRGWDMTDLVPELAASRLGDARRRALCLWAGRRSRLPAHL
jgi:bifunctional non-homologous end joining protein LigD